MVNKSNPVDVSIYLILYCCRLTVSEFSIVDCWCIVDVLMTVWESRDTDSMKGGLVGHHQPCQLPVLLEK
jgi:hypothetical protein